MFQSSSFHNLINIDMLGSRVWVNPIVLWEMGGKVVNGKANQEIAMLFLDMAYISSV